MASIPFYEVFYNLLLTSANSVPIQSLWTAFFTNPVALLKTTDANQYENAGGYGNMTAGAAINIGQGIFGAIFANSVTLPGEGMGISKFGPEQAGIIKGNISSGRSDLENLTISFLDTNASFCEYNLRPWIIMANHKSLKNKDVKSSIVVIQWAKAGPKIPLIPRVIWTFYGACPTSIGSEEWNYGDDNVISRQVEFAYNYYTVDATPGIGNALSVASVAHSVVSKFAALDLTHSPTPVSIEKGGLSSHGSGQLESPRGGKVTADGHPEGQMVVIPEDDLVSRGVNIGLDILNGNSNVTISADDAIERLKGIASELENNVKVPEDDVPVRTQGQEQVGFVEKKPTGPTKDEPDHITREAPEREQSGRIAVGGNSKANAKDNLDTPLFFPGDGDENQKKIAGRTVGGDLDTVEIQTLTFQEVEVPLNGDVGRNIPLQIITVDRDDAREGGNVKYTLREVNANDIIQEANIQAQLVNIPSQDAIGDSHADAQIVTVPKDDDANKSYGTPKIVNVAGDDAATKSYGNAKIVDVNNDDTARKSTIKTQQVNITRTPSDVGEKAGSQIVSVKDGDATAKGSHSPSRTVKVNVTDNIGEFKPGHQKVEAPLDDKANGSGVKAKIVDIKADKGRR